MGTDIIFPAAGFVAMAIEGIRQKTHAMAILEERPSVKPLTYRLRDMTFSRALVLEGNVEHKVMLALTPKTGSGDTWHSYKVLSLAGDVWQEHSRGLIKAEDFREESKSPAHPIPSRDKTG